MKRIKKILVGLIAMVMLVGASMTAFAADEGTTNLPSAKITAISGIQLDGKNKSSHTIYTNDTSATTTMNVLCASDSDGAMTSFLEVTSSNRAVVKADLGKLSPSQEDKKHTRTATLTLTAKGNGKATVTVVARDLVTRKTLKTKKITVTVKTWANKIEFANSSVEEDGNEANSYSIQLANKKGSKLNLGAFVSTDNVSNAKLQYTVAPEDKSAIACDAKGNVSIKREGATGTVTITSTDKYPNNYPEDKKAKVVVSVKTVTDAKAYPLVTSIKIAPDRTGKDKVSSSTKLKDLDYGRVSSNGKQLYLKGNRGDDRSTYKLNCVVNAEASMSDLTFTSNKPTVAKVDAKTGVITGVGNGKATITVTPKMGNNVKATLTVTVDTDVEYINVASTKFTIQANNKDVAKINATTNANAKTKTIAYWVKEITNSKGEVFKNSRESASAKDAWPKGVKAAQYITVDAKGNVKAKQPCEAKIWVRSKSKDDGAATVLAEVDITAEDAVTALTLQAEVTDEWKNDVSAIPNSKQHVAKITAYRTESGNADKLELIPTATWLSSKNKTDTPAVTWTSNKPTVATVEDGKVNLVGNGTAKITAKAASGKSASTTITVKTDAYRLTPAVQVKEENGKKVIYVEGDFTGQKTLASIINATVNADASNKTVTYSPAKIKATDISTDKDFDVTVTTKALVDRSSVEAQYVIRARTPGEDSVYTFVCNGEEKERLELKAGQNATLKVMKDGAYVTNAKLVSDNTKSVAVNANGVVTAKAEASGTPAKVILRSADNADLATIEVVVGRKDATVQTEINKSFKTKLNEENRDHTGVSAKFNEKSRAVQMSILDPKKDIMGLKDTGLVAAMEDIARTSLANSLVFDEVVITDRDNKQYTVTRTSDNELSTSVELTDANGDKVAVDSLGDAVATVLSSHGSRIQDLNGESYKIALKLHYRGASTLTYDLAYTADVAMDAAKYDELVDSKILSAVKKFTDQLENGINFNGETADSNVMSVYYNDASNEFDVMVEDIDVAYEKFMQYSKEYADKSFEELWAEAGQIKDNLDTNIEIDSELKSDAKDIASDLQSVTMAVKSASGFNKVVTEDRPSNVDDPKAYVKKVLEGYFEMLKAEGNGVTNDLGNLIGSVASANVTFKVGTQTYVQSYKVNFLVSDNAYAKAADKRINDKVDENKAKLAGHGFEVAYNDSHRLTIDIKEQKFEIGSWKGVLDQPLEVTLKMLDAEEQITRRLNEILDTMVGYEQNVCKANVVVNGQTTVLVDENNRQYGEGEITSAETGKLLNALVEKDSKTTKATTLRDMDGRIATLKVTYHVGQINRDITMLYTIQFTVEGAKDTLVDEDETKTTSISDNTIDPTETEDETIVDETEDETTEDETDGTTEDENDGATEDENDGTTEDETDETTGDETEEVTEDETDEATEDVTDGAADDNAESDADAVETPAEPSTETIETVDTVEE